jgi:cytochrome c-type biogenesis protein CcmF
MPVGHYVLRFDRVWGKEEPQRVVIGADITVLKNGRVIDVLDPRTNFYRARNEPVPTPSVRSTAREDLYLNLQAFEKDGSSITLNALIEPLVGWIWIGGFIVGLGALIGLLNPRQRVPRTRIVTETAEPAEEEAVV